MASSNYSTACSISANYAEYHLLGYNCVVRWKVNRRIRGTFRLHLQDQVNQTRNKQDAGNKQSLPFAASLWSFFSWLTIRPWIWIRNVPPKDQLTFSGLRYVIYPRIQNSSTSVYLNEGNCQLWLINNKILLSETLLKSSSDDVKVFLSV
jgi:hypothetical protein